MAMPQERAQADVNRMLCGFRLKALNAKGAGSPDETHCPLTRREKDCAKNAQLRLASDFCEQKGLGRPQEVRGMESGNHFRFMWVFFPAQDDAVTRIKRFVDDQTELVDLSGKTYLVQPATDLKPPTGEPRVCDYEDPNFTLEIYNGSKKNRASGMLVLKPRPEATDAARRRWEGDESAPLGSSGGSSGESCEPEQDPARAAASPAPAAPTGDDDKEDGGLGEGPKYEEYNHGLVTVKTFLDPDRPKDLREYRPCGTRSRSAPAGYLVASSKTKTAKWKQEGGAFEDFEVKVAARSPCSGICTPDPFEDDEVELSAGEEIPTLPGPWPPAAAPAQQAQVYLPNIMCGFLANPWCRAFPVALVQQPVSFETVQEQVPAQISPPQQQQVPEQISPPQQQPAPPAPAVLPSHRSEDNEAAPGTEALSADAKKSTVYCRVDKTLKGACPSWLRAILEKNRQAFDFFYAPIDFNTKKWLGFAVVNFKTPKAAQDFKDLFDGLSLQGKTCTVTWHEKLQGLDSVKTHYLQKKKLAKLAAPWQPLAETNGLLKPLFAKNENGAAPSETRSMEAAHIKWMTTKGGVQIPRAWGSLSKRRKCGSR